MKQQLLKSLLVFGLSLLVSSCMVGPNYQKPKPDAPKDWLSKNTPPVANSTLEQAWWKQFNDPILDQFIAKALTDNLDLKIATARIAEARAEHASAVANLLPVVNATANDTRESNQIAFPTTAFDLAKPFSIYQAGFDASWELDIFGGRRREIESAKAELQASEATRDDAKVSLLAEVARTYVEIREYQADLAVTDNTIAADKNTLQIAQERFRAGTIAKIDITKAEAELHKTESQIPHYQSLLTGSEYSMDILLGEKPGFTHPVVSTVQPIPHGNKEIVLAAPADVIANRPDIRKAERDLASATAQQGVATAQFFPDISLSGFLGLLNTDAGDFLRTGSKSWLLGANVAWPILNYSTLSARLDASNAKQQEAFITYQKSIVTALGDVERSVTAYIKDEEENALLDKTVLENQHATDIASMRYKEGLSSFLEVLDSEREWYEAQSHATQSDAQTAKDLISVYKSLGGGWKEPMPQETIKK